MTPDEPARLDLDLSGFHPLDHPLARCHGYPGGRRRHLRYVWDYRLGPQVWAATRCRLRLHRPGQAWGRGQTWQLCLDCLTPLSEKRPAGGGPGGPPS